ncbi:hypothetical protein ABZ508_12785 [Streptomyces lavendulocolor]|uniref:Uncharacterized protein n=1 Tax=Streptomyces lavendulocolor TaxID=67316 RepID=A0ABV2W3V8_9ACTN
MTPHTHAPRQRVLREEVSRGMDIELTYRRGLLRDIGGVPVTYGKRE